MKALPEASRALEPTAVGWALSRRAVGLPEPWARDLYRLLGHFLHSPAATDLRYARLGLIMQLIMRDGDAPAWWLYDDERSARLAAGEWWPERTTLSAHYGGWPYAVKAATALYGVGTQARIPSSRNHVREYDAAYTPEEVELAIVRCHDKLGYWPALQEFLEWAWLERRAARATGRQRLRSGAQQAAPRWPSMTPIRRIYGSHGPYDKALAAAKQRRQTGAGALR